MTEFVFREDAYCRSLPATVTSIAEDGGVVLDRTIFYATSGGQPSDLGQILRADGTVLTLSESVHLDGNKMAIVHRLAENSAIPMVGEKVQLELDWPRRHRMMRMHTALHLLSVVFPFPVTGGSIGEDKGRLDFDMPQIPEDLPALEAQLNAWVDADFPVTAEWITDGEMAANANLIKTMKVKPPMGQGRVRLIRIGEIDLQPCGGTHVRSTREIGPLPLGKIEKKGAVNRRVSLHFA
jgi:misacylated tRNA(Ala) deacylase